MTSEPPPIGEEIPVSSLAQAKEEIVALLTEARSLAEVELAYWQARARYSVGQAIRSALYALVALILFVCTGFALIVGTLLAFAAWLGPLAAVLIVTLLFLAMTGLSGLLAWRHAARLKFPASPAEGTQE